MNSRERKAFEREVYGPDSAPHQIPAERKARSERADAARKIATEQKLPQRIIDRAASYAADGSVTPEMAVEQATVADPDYTPTQAIRPCVLCHKQVEKHECVAWGDGLACCRSCDAAAEAEWKAAGNPPDDCPCGCEGDIETHRR